MSNTVVSIQDIYKQYRLGVIGGGTLKGDLQSWWAHARGKDDPNTVIGSKSHVHNETFMALKGISFNVYQGDTLGIIGANGAGKSTLLKILSRVTAPTKGQILVKGRISSMLEVGTGFNRELTGRENIYMNGAILGMNRAEVTKKLEEIIAFSECEKFIDTPVKRYSSGMYVKLAFSVAAHLDSEILVMDEVLAVGDIRFQQKCLGKMGDVADREGRTVLYVSHNMNTIRQLCNRCVVLEQGELLLDSDTETCITEYMKSQAALKSKHVSLSERKREGRLTGDIHITSIEFLNSETLSYPIGDAIQMRLHYDAKKPIADMRIRLVYKYADKTIIGTSVSDNGFSAHRAGANLFDFRFTVPTLATGSYIASISIYKTNQFNTPSHIDVIHDAFAFDISDGMHEPAQNWKHGVWGHIEFPSIEVL